MPYINKAPQTELQGKSPKMMMYIMVFSVPAITIIATDIAIYFKVKQMRTSISIICLSQMRKMQQEDKRLSVRKENERRTEKV